MIKKTFYNSTSSNFSCKFLQKTPLWQKRLGLCKRNNERTKEIKLDKLVDMALELYDKNQITYEKLSYLLGLSNLNPSEFNIFEEKYEFPLEDEILNLPLRMQRFNR